MTIEAISDTVTRLTTFVTNNFPTADITPGSVLNELLIKLGASLQNNQYNEVQTLSQGVSLAAAEASTTDTYNTTIDAIASNYGATRNLGVLSTGVIQVIISSNQSGVFVPVGTSFTQPALGLTYVTTASLQYSSSPTGTALQMFTNNGVSYVLVPVTASAVGSNYQVQNQAAFTLTSGSTLSGFVSASAYGNFTSGQSKETDQQLIARFKKTITPGSLVSPTAITSYLQQQLGNSNIVLSIAGAGDQEMVRSKDNIMGISTFGMADVYIRTTFGRETQTFTKQATKIASGQWLLSIANSDAPGFYIVTSILPTPVSGVQTQTGSLLVTNTTYGYSAYTGQRNNIVNSAAEARFSMYQTASITFNYTESPAVAVGASASFDIVVSGQPGIQEAQQLFLNDSTRILNADYLVKGVVPCFVSLNIQLVRKHATDTLTSIGVSNLQQDIFNYVNTIPFGEALSASKLVSICHNYPIDRVDLPITMNGQILCLDSTTINLSGSDTLVIPTSVVPQGVSPKTVQFFIDYFVANSTTNTTNNIAISLV